MLPKPAGRPVRLRDYSLQYAQAVVEQFELNEREEECWRMYGVVIEHVMDERIVYHV